MTVKDEPVVVVTPRQFKEICNTEGDFSFLDAKHTTNDSVQVKRTFVKNGVLYVENFE